MADHPSVLFLEALAAEVGKLLLANGQRLVTAESCTGGWAAQCVTAIAGSSHWFERGFITYSNEAKIELLDVGAGLLTEQGAVSEATAAAMAMGALQHKMCIRDRHRPLAARLESARGQPLRSGGDGRRATLGLAGR